MHPGKNSGHLSNDHTGNRSVSEKAILQVGRTQDRSDPVLDLTRGAHRHTKDATLLDLGVPNIRAAPWNCDRGATKRTSFSLFPFQSYILLANNIGRYNICCLFSLVNLSPDL